MSKSHVVVNYDKDFDTSKNPAIEMMNKEISIFTNNNGSKDNNNWNLDCHAGRRMSSLEGDKEIKYSQIWASVQNDIKDATINDCTVSNASKKREETIACTIIDNEWEKFEGHSTSNSG